MRPSQTDDLYARLGVSPDASVEQLKSAYRKAARQWHPDVHPGLEPEYSKEFIAITEAFYVLSDDTKRQSYARKEYSFVDYGRTAEIEEMVRRVVETLRKTSPALAAIFSTPEFSSAMHELVIWGAFGDLVPDKRARGTGTKTLTEIISGIAPLDEL
jgi:curved DNA-binding protein CbpA